MANRTEPVQGFGYGSISGTANMCLGGGMHCSSPSVPYELPYTTILNSLLNNMGQLCWNAIHPQLICTLASILIPEWHKWAMAIFEGHHFRFQEILQFSFFGAKFWQQDSRCYVCCGLFWLQPASKKGNEIGWSRRFGSLLPGDRRHRNCVSTPLGHGLMTLFSGLFQTGFNRGWPRGRTMWFHHGWTAWFNHGSATWST